MNRLYSFKELTKVKQELGQLCLKLNDFLGFFIRIQQNRIDNKIRKKNEVYYQQIKTVPLKQNISLQIF